jgi:predicted DNA-binding transcriptional regulator AlpA
MTNEEPFLTAAEVSQRYRSSTAQIYQWVRDRRIPEYCVVRIGRKILFSAVALTRWETKGGSPTTSTLGHDEDLIAGPLDTQGKN